jgi:hypothetical protein
MSDQIRNTPTIDSVTREIEAFEARYGLETEVFVAENGRVLAVDPDDGVEWLYLVEQLQVLRELAVESLYASSQNTTHLQNDAYPLEKLAA